MAGPKISFSRLRPIVRSLSSEGAPGDGGHDRDLVLGADFRLETGAQPDVLVVEVHIDELTQLAVFVKQAIFEAWIPRVERGDRGREVSGPVSYTHLTLPTNR